MASWVHSITSPLKKACTFLSPTKHKKTQTERGRHDNDLHGEVMACAYEDVQVMWSMLHHHNTKPRLCMHGES
ncbi:uncharacterized protein LOC18430155 [Amborella trichopoda]|uniref:Uncharacterized protein n=1 Tax=Amborella trichopoda TaxID=13333 RepID=W1P327_AMBTC|nr:uncharacterized protein LOC18430155 [Amborella trichopoda]ERN02054.1 hypothetical protein AMTR_s00045p00134040 [Amborella trichopoda]|eukprot:XP_006840379.1 uncharacterized protein LOC18430155 [Amborella trichopoda]